MNTEKLFFFFFITTSCVLIITKHPSVSAQNSLCESSWSCAPAGPTIHYPFWLYKQQSKTCSSQGFALLCSNKSQTILSLPFSGEFTVKYIDYDSSIIFINDPDSCLPNRIQNLSLFSSPFRPPLSRTNYKFVNCSSNVTDFIADNVRTRAVKFSCLSGKNHSVYAVSSLVSDQELPSSCVKISSNSSNSSKWVESQWWSFMTERGDLQLRWVDTRCLPCAAQGLACGVTDDGNEMGCISSSSKQAGLPRGAKYGIIVGVAIPALVFLIGLACYLCGWIRVYSSRRRSVANFSSTISPQSFPNITTGLDGMIIESYPMTVVGESRRLPKPNESTCSICLCEYQPKEAFRTLPGCTHFFHCDCIDEWLKLNGSCPLCRTSPESMLMAPRPSVSSPTTTPP